MPDLIQDAAGVQRSFVVVQAVRTLANEVRWSFERCAPILVDFGPAASPHSWPSCQRVASWWKVDAALAARAGSSGWVVPRRGPESLVITALRLDSHLSKSGRRDSPYLASCSTSPYLKFLLVPHPSLLSGLSKPRGTSLSIILSFVLLLFNIKLAMSWRSKLAQRRRQSPILLRVQ